MCIIRFTDINVTGTIFLVFDTLVKNIFHSLFISTIKAVLKTKKVYNICNNSWLSVLMLLLETNLDAETLHYFFLFNVQKNRFLC